LPATSIHTWEQFTRDFLDAFVNYNYEELCNEILKLRKKRDEFVNDFSLIFKCIIYKFHLEDMPPVGDLIPHLLSLFDEKDQIVEARHELYPDTNMHIDGKDTHGLVEKRFLGYLFTLGDFDLKEHIFPEEFYASSHPSIPQFLPDIEE
jgi:hypothetical protein